MHDLPVMNPCCSAANRFENTGLIDRIDNVTTVQRNDVNDFMNAIESIFENAKNASFASVATGGTYAGSKSKDKLWFTNDCRSVRKKYHLAKRIH